MTLKRREFLVGAGSVLAASNAAAANPESARKEAETGRDENTLSSGQHASTVEANCGSARVFNGPYEGHYLDQIAFPLGGMGAGMLCLEGTGALTRFSLHSRPELAREPCVFAAISIKGQRPQARVLEAPVPAWKLRPQFPGPFGSPAYTCWGLPRFHEASFKARFPFATLPPSSVIF